MSVDALFTPLRVKNLTLRNRFVMSAMSRYSSPDRRPGRDLADYYRRRAEGGRVVGEPMSEAAGEEIIEAFATAAAAATRLGFDSIDIHAAHGFLLDQFMWSTTNQRTDRWGGPRLVDRLGWARQRCHDVFRRRAGQTSIAGRTRHTPGE